MLPSKEIRSLAQEVILVGVRTEDPISARLRKEFDVPWLNSWVIVLDGKGETLITWVGDSAASGCKQNAADRFPRLFATRMRESLQWKESVQELERRWRRQPAKRQGIDELTNRLTGMCAFHRLQKVFNKAAANPMLPEKKRSEYKIRTFLARSQDDSDHGRDPQESCNRLVLDGERLLMKLADHPKAADLVSVLFGKGYCHAFDVPGRCAQGIERLKKMADKLQDPAPLQRRLRQLSKMCRDWVGTMQSYLDQDKNSLDQSYIKALMGDAEATIAAFSQEPYKDIPQYQEWVRQAKLKMGRGSKGLNGQ